MLDEYKVFGEKFREQRKRLGLSQAELAEKVGPHEKQIYRLESGKNSPSFHTVLKIIHELDMDIRVLDINNLKNFNPIKDEILSILETSKDEDLILYRNVINAIQTSKRITTKQRQELLMSAKLNQKTLL